MDVIFHKSKKYISEDIDYYMSEQRDMHSMIKPDNNLISMTMDSDCLTSPSKDRCSNVLYPFEINSVSKIYIGLSFPLFSNNWGTSFLRHLLKIIKKDGAIILPVYAEGQAYEKGYWSRSFLENIFRSRSLFKGMSNIWAENDGVMSMRIGRVFPKKHNSTFNYFIENFGQKIWDKDNSEKLKEIKETFNTSILSALVEKVILDEFGSKKKINYCDFGEQAEIPFEVANSNYINVKELNFFSKTNTNFSKLNSYFSYRSNKTFKTKFISDFKFEDLNNTDVISIINNSNNLELIKKLKLYDIQKPIIYFGTINEVKEFESKFNFIQYSNFAACKLNSNGTIINHYSDIIQDEIQNELLNTENRIILMRPL